MKKIIKFYYLWLKHIRKFEFTKCFKFFNIKLNFSVNSEYICPHCNTKLKTLYEFNIHKNDDKITEIKDFCEKLVGKQILVHTRYDGFMLTTIKGNGKFYDKIYGGYYYLSRNTKNTINFSESSKEIYHQIKLITSNYFQVCKDGSCDNYKIFSYIQYQNLVNLVISV